MTPATPTTDLTNCDIEPIHIPGSIQPHGCLLACDAAARLVLRHSANAPAMLGLQGDPNERPLAEVLDHEAAHRIANALSMTPEGQRPGLVFGLELPGGCFDLTVHRYLGHTMLEFEPSTSNPGSTLSTARAIIDRLRMLPTAEKLVQRAAGLIQAQLGYDRVMIYELGSDGAGKVVSEAKTSMLESFRGQYFPASDIPKQARTLYLKNPIRMIGDASYRPIPILPVLDGSGEPLDLSHAHLRSVSPIHCEYLRNMGVAASLSISIIIDGQLWGLIACHHYTPRVLPMADRAAAEMVGEFFSLHLDALRRRQALEAAQVARRSLDDLLVDASRNEDIGTALRNRLPRLAELVPSDGVALSFDGAWSGYGLTPTEEQAGPLLRLALTSPEGQIRATHHLSALLPQAEELTAEIAGALIIPLSQRPRDFLIYLRREAVQTLDWAGDPNKTYESGPLGDRLTPRKSFAIWKQMVQGKSAPWSESDRQFAEEIRRAVVEVLLTNSELLADERERAAVRQRVLNEELNHRVKNILAIIRSLVNQQPQQGETLDSYAETLRGRIQALALAHDQVVRSDGGGSLADLMMAELGPYAGQDGRVRLDGPALTLDARAYSVMALVLHELATNAVKYGALSTKGRLDVRWELAPGGACVIRWQESDGPPVRVPTRLGFGTALIDRSIPFDLGGQVKVDYAISGLRAELTLPPRFVQLTRAAAAEPSRPALETQRGDPILGKRVLLVEDQLLIAMSLEADLQDHGLEVVGIAPNATVALALIERTKPDLAVLDVNLGDDETSFVVAEALSSRQIRFVFATGYGTSFSLPETLSHVPVVSKPYDVAEVMARLRRQT